MVSAAEFARIHNISPRSVSEYLAKGKLSGVKFGSRLALDPSQVLNDLILDGRSRITEPQPRRIGTFCVNCGNDMNGIDGNLCSNKCFEEYNILLVWEEKNRIRMPGSDFPSYLKPSFQDWLLNKDVKALKRTEGGTSKIISPKVKRNKKLSKQQKQLLDLLLSFKGYIVPYEKIMMDMFGDPGMKRVATSKKAFIIY